MTVQIEIPKKKEAIILAILKLFGAKVISRSQDKNPLYNQIDRAVNELNQIKEGKLKGVPAREFLREFQG